MPLVLHAPTEASGRGAQHANSVENLFHGVPGLIVGVPSTPYDAKGMMTAAIRYPDPVLVCSHKNLYGSKGRSVEATAIGDVPDEPYEILVGRAEIRRPGADITIVGALLMVHRAIAAAEELARDGIEAEVIDLRWLSSLDTDTVVASVRRTGRCLIIQEGSPLGGWSGTGAAAVADRAIDALDGPVRRVTGPDHAIPFRAPPRGAGRADRRTHRGRGTVAGGTLMASDVIVPEVGELGMDVTFVRWLKAPGDAVEVGESLFELDTDKSVMVVEAYAAGILDGVTAGEGDIVAPRQVIGRIRVPGDTLTQSRVTEPPPPGVGSPGTVGNPPTVPATPVVPATAQAGPSPRARRLADELGVDLGAISGSGPDGLVTEADVRRAGAGEGSEPPPLPSGAERARRAVASSRPPRGRRSRTSTSSLRRTSRKAPSTPGPQRSSARPGRARSPSIRTATLPGGTTRPRPEIRSSWASSSTRLTACSSRSSRLPSGSTSTA